MSSSELELSQSTVVSSSEEESNVMTSVIVPIFIFFEESDGLILVDWLFDRPLALLDLSQEITQLLPILVFLTPEEIEEALVLPFTDLTDEFLLECLNFMPVGCSLMSAILVFNTGRNWRNCSRIHS